MNSLLNKVKEQSMISWGVSNKNSSIAGISHERSESKGISIVENTDKMHSFSFAENLEYKHQKNSSKSANDEFFNLFSNDKVEEKAAVRMTDT
mmetsp:Transcript_37161/g.36745  ORF Transcript_37161/g.36745 Transcript_37161/m.36745 type:complete len:93 (-) Transcript_37161:32-310(-)